jgi:hypothetical protein
MTVFREQNFDFFGLSRIESMNYDSISSRDVQYYMYPRCLDDSKWLNRSQPIANGQGSQDIKFYYSESSSCGGGIRVFDQECFGDLISLFSKCQHRLRVPIDGMQSELFGYLTIV